MLNTALVEQLKGVEQKFEKIERDLAEPNIGEDRELQQKLGRENAEVK